MLFKVADNVRVSLQLLIFFEINSAKWKSNIIQQKNSGRFTLMLPGLMPVIVMVSTIRIIAIGLKPCTAVEKYIQRTEMQMRNALLKLRFLYLDRISGYFNKTHEVKQVDGRLIFNDRFTFGINWGWWHPNEHWGNVKDAENPYIIWLADQVSFKDNVVHLTTDLNDDPEDKIGADLLLEIPVSNLWGLFCYNKGTSERWPVLVQYVVDRERVPGRDRRFRDDGQRQQRLYSNPSWVG